MHRGQNVFSQLMQVLPWREFSRLVTRYRGDRGVHKLNCAQQFRAMAFARLTRRMRPRTSGPGNAFPRTACTRTNRRLSMYLGFASTKQSDSPASRNGCWVESASRALKSYTSCGSNCPERKSEVPENKGLIERLHRKKYDHIFKSFVFSHF